MSVVGGSVGVRPYFQQVPCMNSMGSSSYQCSVSKNIRQSCPVKPTGNPVKFYLECKLVLVVAIVGLVGCSDSVFK